jgi:hypothetical protein
MGLFPVQTEVYAMQLQQFQCNELDVNVMNLKLFWISYKRSVNFNFSNYSVLNNASCYPAGLHSLQQTP